MAAPTGWARGISQVPCSAGEDQGMKIRTFDFEKHYDSVMALWQASGPGVRISPSDSPDSIRHKLERDPVLFLVAEEAGALVGAVLGGYDGRRGMVYHLAVRQAEWHHGVGRRLLQELEARLRAKGCIKYYLLVTVDNSQAIAFYEHLGMEVMDLHVMGKVIG